MQFGKLFVTINPASEISEVEFKCICKGVDLGKYTSETAYYVYKSEIEKLKPIEKKAKAKASELESID